MLRLYCIHCSSLVLFVESYGWTLSLNLIPSIRVATTTTTTTTTCTEWRPTASRLPARRRPRCSSELASVWEDWWLVAGLESFSFFTLATAQQNATTTGPKPGTLGNGNVDFVPTPSNDTITVDDVNWITRPFNFTSYRQAGDAIRSGTTRQCFGNLSLALGSIGPISSASSSGASGALTLLPTAGALIGAPAKELWILYKLVPLAGVLSMLLSLGGNIVPNTAGEYELEGYNYGGVIGTASGRDDDVASSQSSTSTPLHLPRSSRPAPKTPSAATREPLLPSVSSSSSSRLPSLSLAAGSRG